MQPFLAQGQGHGGHAAAAEPHTARPTPLGGAVTAETELTAIDRRRLVFRFTVRDAAGPVADGEHERFVVDTGKFLAKAAARGKAE